MPNIVKLKEKIKESGMTKVAIASKAGMSRETLYNRLEGKGEFTVSEVIGLTAILQLSIPEREAIFFTQQVELN